MMTPESAAQCSGQDRKQMKKAKESKQSITYALSGLKVVQQIDNNMDIDIERFHVTVVVEWNECPKHRINFAEEIKQGLINAVSKSNDHSMKLKYLKDVDRFYVELNDKDLNKKLRNIDIAYGCYETLKEMGYWKQFDPDVGIPGHRVFHINPSPKNNPLSNKAKQELNGKDIKFTTIYSKIVAKNEYKWKLSANDTSMP